MLNVLYTNKKSSSTTAFFIPALKKISAFYLCRNLCMDRQMDDKCGPFPQFAFHFDRAA